MLLRFNFRSQRGFGVNIDPSSQGCGRIKAVVTAVAKECGLQAGHEIVAINNEPVRDGASVIATLKAVREPGTLVTLSVSSGSNIVTAQRMPLEQKSGFGCFSPGRRHT